MIQYSSYLIDDIIPPPKLRYNVMDGWLTVGGKIRWRLEWLKSSKPVQEGIDLCYPNLDKDDMILAVVPLAIKTDPATWAQESHFGHAGEYRGSPLKVLNIPYHVTLVNADGEILEHFFKEHKAETIAYDIIEDIAEEHMGIPDVQMETIKIKFGYQTQKVENELFDRLRVLFYGDDICSPLLLKQAILLFDDIHFHDRPGLVMEDWGTIGSDSRIRPFLYSFARDGIPIIVHKDMKARMNNVFIDSVANEIEDPRFSDIFFEGFN